MNDARRFLKNEQSQLIPCKLRQFVCPVVSREYDDKINSWDDVGVEFRLNLHAAKSIACHSPYQLTIKPEHLLLKGTHVWDELDFYAENPPIRSRRILSWSNILKPVWGFCVWWEAELVPGVTVCSLFFLHLCGINLVVYHAIVLLHCILYLREPSCKFQVYYYACTLPLCCSSVRAQRRSPRTGSSAICLYYGRLSWSPRMCSAYRSELTTSLDEAQACAGRLSCDMAEEEEVKSMDACDCNLPQWFFFLCFVCNTKESLPSEWSIHKVVNLFTR